MVFEGDKFYYFVFHKATLLTFLGVGSNVSFTAVLVAVSNYFEVKRPMALGVATSGAGIGILYSAPLSRFLFDNLTYQETMTVLGAIALQMCVPAMLIKPESYW